MYQNDIEENLQSLSTTDLRIILLVIRLRWLRHKASRLRPRQLLIPISIAQIIAFVLSAFTNHFLHYAGTANMVIIGIALIPMTLSRPIKAHWVKNYD